MNQEYKHLLNGPRLHGPTSKRTSKVTLILGQLADLTSLHGHQNTVLVAAKPSNDLEIQNSRLISFVTQQKMSPLSEFKSPFSNIKKLLTRLNV